MPEVTRIPEIARIPEVKRIDNIYNAPIGSFVLRAAAQIDRDGLAWGLGSPSWATSAFYIEEDGEIVAVLVWAVEEWKQEAFIHLGYVLPEYRRRGLYTHLWNALVTEAKTRKLRSIGSGTHPKNLQMQAVCERQGRKVDSINYRFDLAADTSAAATSMTESPGTQTL